MPTTHHPYVGRVASNVKAELVRAGILQKQLAISLHRSPEWVSARLRAQIALDTDDLGKIAHIIGCPLEALTGNNTGAPE